MAPVPMGPSIRVVFEGSHFVVEAWGNGARMLMQEFRPETDGPDALRKARDKANEWAKSMGVTLKVNTHLEMAFT